MRMGKSSLHKTVIPTQLSRGVRTIAFFEALKGVLFLSLAKQEGEEAPLLS